MSEKKSREWRQIQEWACRNVGIELIGHRAAYSSAMWSKGALIGEKCPTTTVRYRIPTRGHYASTGYPRCYVLWQGQSLDEMKETFAFLKMVYDNLSYVLIY